MLCVIDDSYEFETQQDALSNHRVKTNNNSGSNNKNLVWNNGFGAEYLKVDEEIR